MTFSIFVQESNKLLYNMQLNEISGRLNLVGNGAVSVFQILNNMKTGIDGEGFPRIDFRVYDDISSTTVCGANHFGAFAEGLSAFVDFNKNIPYYIDAKNAQNVA
jgi:hypothetical protein